MESFECDFGELFKITTPLVVTDVMMTTTGTKQLDCQSTNDSKMERGQEWRQYIIAGNASTALLCIGYCMGWTSPVLEVLEGDGSPLPGPISGDQASWIGSLFTIGGIFGPFIVGFLAPRIGRKWSVLSCAVPILIGWILVAIAKDVVFIYAGRVAWGVGAGMAFTASPMYCAEIATDNCRGALGSFLQIFITCGFLMIYAVGPFASYDGIAYIGITVVCAFGISFFFMPESPIYHLTKNDKESAAKCLMTLRGRTRAGIEGELAKMAADVQSSLGNTASIADVFHGSNFTAFYISCALIFFQQCCGVNAVLFYLHSIFLAAGSVIDADTSSIIVGAVQVLASLMTSFVVDRLGRKLLLLISTAGTAIALGLLGIYYMLLIDENYIVESLGFLPLVSLMLFIITYSWGLGPLPFAIMSEMLAVEVRAPASSIVISFGWVLTFLVTRYFIPLAEAVGMYTTFWIFAVCCVTGFFFTLFLVPETKGKSFNEIQEMLAGKTETGVSEKPHDNIQK